MKRRAFLGLGGSFIGVGAMYGTGAFSSVRAGRGVSVSEVSDTNALLGIENVDAQADPVFTNHTSMEMAVTLADIDTTTIVFDGGASSYEFMLQPGESRTVSIETEGNGHRALVEVTAELRVEGGKAGQITLERDFSVPQAKIIDFTGTAKSAGSSGKFEFEMENVGTKPVTFTGLGICATTTAADSVRTNGNATFSGDGVDLLTAPIPIDSSSPTQDTRQSFDGFTLSPGRVSPFKFDRFKNSEATGNSNVDMRGQGVRIRMYFGDAQRWLSETQRRMKRATERASSSTPQ